MKDRIGFVAVGQAGGNIGMKLEQKGYKVMYINTSQEDLDTLGLAKFKHHIKGGEGCNKDRLKAKQALIDDYDTVRRKVQEFFGDIKFIYVIFSSGGGTGSGEGPMLSDLLLGDCVDGFLKAENVGIITILPSLKEPVKANLNSYECFNELRKIDGLSGSFVIDNNLGDKMVLNGQFVHALTSFFDIPNKHKSERGNIDKAEIMETIKPSGMIKIAQLPGKDSRTENIIDKLEHGIFAESERDGIIKYITVSQAGNFDIARLQQETGMPIDIFQTYNDHATICCLSGLTLPATRLEKTYQMIEENKEKVLRSMNANTQIEMREGINFLQDSARSKSVRETRNSDTSTSSRSRRDLMQKYL